LVDFSGGNFLVRVSTAQFPRYWKPGCAKQFDDHLLIFISTSTASQARLFLQEITAGEEFDWNTAQAPPNLASASQPKRFFRFECKKNLGSGVTPESSEKHLTPGQIAHAVHCWKTDVEPYLATDHVWWGDGPRVGSATSAPSSSPMSGAPV
jgi:hypothetical protein